MMMMILMVCASIDQSSQGALQNTCPGNVPKIHRKTPGMMSCFSNLQARHFIKNVDHRSCFPVDTFFT